MAPLAIRLFMMGCRDRRNDLATDGLRDRRNDLTTGGCCSRRTDLAIGSRRQVDKCQAH